MGIYRLLITPHSIQAKKPPDKKPGGYSCIGIQVLQPSLGLHNDQGYLAVQEGNEIVACITPGFNGAPLYLLDIFGDRRSPRKENLLLGHAQRHVSCFDLLPGGGGPFIFFVRIVVQKVTGIGQRLDDFGGTHGIAFERFSRRRFEDDDEASGIGRKNVGDGHLRESLPAFEVVHPVGFSDEFGQAALHRFFDQARGFR